MNAKTIALMIAVNALLSSALIALAQLWLAHPPGLAVLDVAELYRLKEAQVAALLVKSDTRDEERTAALHHAASFGAEVSHLLEILPEECRCLVLARGAVVGSAPSLPDLTPEVRRRLGL